MSARLDRLGGLFARYRVDRRLPPQVLDLYTQVLELRRTDAVNRRSAASRSPLGPVSDAGVLVRLGARRVYSNGPLDTSTHQLGLDNVALVSGVLSASGTQSFLVDRCGDGFVLGVELDRRREALGRLVAGLSHDRWLLSWSDGRRSGTVDLTDAAGDRRVRRARSWRLFRPFAWGGAAIGADSATEITFWDLGASGELELIGTRGHHRFHPDSAATLETIGGVDIPGRTAFPIARDLRFMDEPIDIVYTWVDGSDPAWQAEFRATAEQGGRSVDESALDPARYRSRDELKYSLRSVWAFCGWARKIFIVTSGQVPAWLAHDDRVRIVAHDEILPTEVLPTFNSHAIESALHRIDGLAEHFVYFNDDMFVGRPLRPEHFFTSNGLARLFPGGARVHGVEHDQTLAVDTGALRGRELLAQRFGRVVLDKPLHSPYPLRRSAMFDVDRDFEDVVRRTASSRFRSPTDLSIAASFAMHYAVAAGRGVFGEIAAEYVHVESGRLAWHLDRLRLGQAFDTFCINETADVDSDTTERERALVDFFDEYFPVAAPWERDGASS